MDHLSSEEEEKSEEEKTEEKSEDEEEKSEEEKTEEKNEDEEKSSPPIKRPRGRPPKKPKPEVGKSQVVDHMPVLEPLFDFSGFHDDSMIADTIPLLPIAHSEIFCEICKKGNDEEKLVLCDRCDKGYHLYCLPEPLGRVPSGKWYCDKCASKGEEKAKLKKNLRQKKLSL